MSPDFPFAASKKSPPAASDLAGDCDNGVERGGYDETSGPDERGGRS
jgi:hypothetical protein